MVNTYLYHSGSVYYLRLFEDHVAMFSGDVCSAAVIDVLDYLTSSRISELDAAGEKEGIPWVRVTLNKLRGYICGMYSTRRIQDRIGFLLANQLLVIPADQPLFGKSPDYPLTFCLNRGNIDRLLQSGRRISYENYKRQLSPENQEPPDETSKSNDCNGDKCRQSQDKPFKSLDSGDKRTPFVAEGGGWSTSMGWSMSR